MRVVSAVLLAMLGGKANPGADDVKKILGSVGVEADKADVERLLKELEGKDVKELIEAGRKKLQSMPSGGGVAAAPAGGAAAGGAAPKKEEKKEEPSEADEDMGFSLFD